MSVKRESPNKEPHSKYFSDPGLKHPSVERAQQIDEDPPYERLKFLLGKDAKSRPPTKTVLHWFRMKDLRIEDNKALSAASKLVSQTENAQLLTLVVFQPSEFDFHGVGDARRAFVVDTTKILKSKLDELDIPLVCLISKSHKDTARKIHEFAKSNDVTDIYGNFEYEYDELCRDIDVSERLYEDSIRFKLFHDQTVVEPGTITNHQGEPRRVFTPFWHDWIPTISKDPKKFYLDLEPPLSEQAHCSLPPKGDADLDELDDILNVNREGLAHISNLWPPGHEGATEKLDIFLDKKIKDYGDLRSFPAKDCTSRMSPYLATGAISVREVLSKVRKQANGNKNFGTSSHGADAWVRELAFREHYRQVVACVMPHIVMNMPSSLKLANVRTEQNEEAWERWCEGKTGMPFIDAGMRQLNTEGYMHNRCRMNVSSYLRMNLLIDFRMGMRYFANKLVDWDCCNNCFGWDPNYTVFNPVLQGEKCDSDGEYIRKWVPELKDLKGKAVFDPYNRLSKSDFKKLGYPAPMIDQEEGKERSKARFKEASRKQVKKEEAD